MGLVTDNNPQICYADKLFAQFLVIFANFWREDTQKQKKQNKTKRRTMKAAFLKFIIIIIIIN